MGRNHLKEVERKVLGQYERLSLLDEGMISEREKLEYKSKLIEDLRDFILEIEAKMHKKNRELMKSEERYRRITDAATDYIFTVRIENRRPVETIHSPACVAVTGYTPEDYASNPDLWIRMVHEEDREAVIDQSNRILSGQDTQPLEHRILRKDGVIRWISKTLVSHYDTEGRCLYYDGLIKDITERKEAEVKLQQSEARFRTMFDTVTDGLFLSDLTATKYILANKACLQMLGYTIEEFMELKLEDIHPPEDLPFVRAEIAKFNLTAMGRRVEVRFLRKDRSVFFAEVNQISMTFEDRDYVLIMFRDITERKQLEERLEYFAYHDALTGLPNRNLFVDRLAQELARANFHKRPTAVLAIDINGFKAINDTFGLDTGDNVLKEVGGLLSASLRKGDTVARLGGDDFGIILNDVARSKDIILVVEKIMKNISQPITVNGKEIVLTLSIGISVYPDDAKDAHEMMRNADMSLSKAKQQQGRKNFQFYTADMNDKASEFVLLEEQLRNALKNEEFILYYQPYWEINTKKLAGMEALLRWQSKNLGLVAPGRFIPVLEETGMILEVGEWIFRTACRQAKEWHDRGYPVPVSINLSMVQFRQRDLANTLERIIKEAGVAPQFLTLEITESAFMQDVEFTNSVIKKLKDLGVSISIDDFGTGYSSLSYLKRFPVDNLKIDISFIREIATDPDTASIVTAIISMARTLNLKTIAEGVETEEQWKILRLLRCHLGQGYLFSPPLPSEEAEKLLKYQKPINE